MTTTLMRTRAASVVNWATKGVANVANTAIPLADAAVVEAKAAAGVSIKVTKAVAAAAAKAVKASKEATAVDALVVVTKAVDSEAKAGAAKVAETARGAA